jgi:hypothetical protein
LGEDEGMLILSVASHISGASDVADRTFLSYEYEAESGDFIVQSRELAEINSPNTENQFGDWLKLRDSDFYFAFVDFADPLSLAPSTIVGDYNGSGTVEQGDLDLVLLNWGADWPPEVTGWVNDQPTDGAVNQNDLDNVLLNWGNTAQAAAANAVPEPTCVVILLVGTGAALLHRRRGPNGGSPTAHRRALVSSSHEGTTQG